jgi:hypothetical protein
LIRIMIEGKDQEMINEDASHLADLIAKIAEE